MILFISSFLIETKGIPYENQLFNGVEKGNLSTAQVATILWFASLNSYLLLCNIRKLKASFLISMPKYILEMTIDGFCLQNVDWSPISGKQVLVLEAPFNSLGKTELRVQMVLQLDFSNILESYQI